jgi:hypothetical protein
LSKLVINLMRIGELSAMPVLLPQVLQSTVEQYKHRHELENVEPDEMIVSAGDYLLHVLEPVQQQLDRRKYMAAAAAGLGLTIGAVLLARHAWGGSSSSSSVSSSKVKQ